MFHLEVQIQPNAKVNQIVSYAGGVLKVKIAAPPVEGKANKMLALYLSEVLDIPKSSIDIEHGLTGKKKLLAIENFTEDKLKTRLEGILK
jgi:uncharacterized protein